MQYPVQPAHNDGSSYATRFLSTRVRISTTVTTLGGNNEKYQLDIDSTTDIPSIALNFIRNHHATLRNARVSPIPPCAISLHRVNGSPQKYLGYVRFVLTLGNKLLLIEALVIPHLGIDVILFYNNIMKAFSVKLDWSAEILLFRDSNISIPAIHTKNNTWYQVTVLFCNQTELRHIYPHVCS